MFLRKLFNSENKLTWVFIDLLIVIIGVYCAFLIQNYAENQKNAKERDRVVTALKYEMEAFRFLMTEISAGMKGETQKMKAILAETNYSDFSNSRFIEPQYDYQTIEYALNLQNSSIVDFELYNALQSLYVEIKKIEHAERLLTETSRRYHTLPSNLNKESDAYKLGWTENYDNFVRYITLTEDRGSISSRIAKASTSSLSLVNKRLGPKKSKQIETELILGYAKKVASEEHAVLLGKKYFPSFSEKEIKQLYQQATQSKSNTKE
ncbi:hypothetical protein [Ekhidna sp.]|uniref:hypothetical protein n=1 Tax=Ekhidna sp. TaxID=2608089 RepID=UPI003B514683